MSRSLTIIRNIGSDHKYKSANVMSLINKVMKDGKKSIAEKIVYGALEIIEKTHSANPTEILETSLENLRPMAEVRYKKVGGATCAVPREPSERRKQFLAMFWLLKAANARSEKTMKEKLAEELMAASKNEGGAVQEKLQLHKLAESNRAYAVLNW